ncbi:MAG: hypothetical protein WCZ27_03535 [Tissierellaceae bacterium]
MYGVIVLLIFIALGLHLNPNSKDLSLGIQIRLIRLVVCISIAIFVPAVVQYTFWDVSKYDPFVFRPAFMFVIGTIFAFGLQLLIYGKLSTDWVDDVLEVDKKD